MPDAPSIEIFRLLFEWVTQVLDTEFQTQCAMTRALLRIQAVTHAANKLQKLDVLTL